MHVAFVTYFGVLAETARDRIGVVRVLLTEVSGNRLWHGDRHDAS